MKIFLVSLALTFISQNDSDVDMMKKELIAIQSYYEEGKLESFQQDIKTLLEDIKSFEKSSDSAFLSSIEEDYKKIQYGHYLIKSLEDENTLAGDQYFKIWDRVNNKKKRVDNLYTSTELIGSQALAEEKQVLKIRKKHIYSAYNAIYDHYMKRLKVTNECDYYTKIEILGRVRPVLEVTEQLLFQDGTRTFEKELKAITDVQQMEEKLINYSFDDEEEPSSKRKR